MTPPNRGETAESRPQEERRGSAVGETTEVRPQEERRGSAVGETAEVRPQAKRLGSGSAERRGEAPAAEPSRGSAVGETEETRSREERRGSAFDDLRALYADFDRETDAIAPVCRASGRCCDFEAWGHTLFASKLEIDLLLAESGLASFDPATKLCPFWKERRCAARTPRPLGCRAYFCDESKTAAMQALHERFLRRLKDLHDRHAIPWHYAPLLRHLADAVPRGA